MSAAEQDPAPASDPVLQERLDLLALCTETGRLRRAGKERARVQAAVDGPDLFVAAVGNYNVVVDRSTRRIQHGCRDFLGQAPRGMLCKHVAALLLEIDPQVAVSVLRGLTDPAGGWHLEVIAARGFARKD